MVVLGMVALGLPIQPCKASATSATDPEVPGYSYDMSACHVSYPLVNEHSNGKSQFLMGKSTINGHFQ